MPPTSTSIARCRGSVASATPAWPAELRAATRRAYDNLLQLCIDEEAGLLVIAGDVYDGDWRSYETGEYFVRGLRRLRDSGIEVALLYGNHDAESSITKRLTMPDGVRVLSTSEPESVEFPDLGVVVHGQGYGVRDVLENLAQHYPHRRDGWVNVGVLHTGFRASPDTPGTPRAPLTTSPPASTSISPSATSTSAVSRPGETSRCGSAATCKAAILGRPARREPSSWMSNRMVLRRCASPSATSPAGKCSSLIWPSARTSTTSLTP